MRLHELLTRGATDAPALIHPLPPLELASDSPVMGGRSEASSAGWTFGELADEVARVVAVVGERTAPGDRIALVGRNRPSYVAALYGIPAAGRVAVPLNQRLAPAELDAQARRVGAALTVDDWGAWEAEVASAPPAEPVAGTEDDPAWILFTSGTTGTPKGAVLTHRSLLAAVRGANAARPVAGDDVYLYCFPLCHVAAYNVLCLHAEGRPVVLMAGFDAAELPRQVRAHGVTTMSLAPTMLAMLLDDPSFDPSTFAGVRQVAYGASSMSPDLFQRATETLGIGFAQGYGMTELSGNAVFLDEEGHRTRPRAAGRPSPEVDVRLAPDGEILLRGPQVMAGYWDEPEATAATIVDGWLHTGDLGEIDEDGYVHVVDRSKDIVISGGENVSSREVEDVLSTHPAVRQVAVVGVPDDRWGEAVCAVVVARAPVTLEELVDHTRGVLGGFKQPRRLVLVDELPTNAGGKVLKRVLREQLAHG